MTGEVKALYRRIMAVAKLLRLGRVLDARGTALDAMVELDWLASDQFTRGPQPGWQWEWTVWLAAAVTTGSFPDPRYRCRLPEPVT